MNKNFLKPISETLNFDVVVIGGGMAGICAAIASARQGAKTALVQDRPVLGGNASSEIRMHITGATRHGQAGRDNLRETGIIEEILLENKYRNPAHSYGMFDTLLWEKCYYQENLSLYLNTYINEVKTENAKIVSVSGTQMSTEKQLTFASKMFIDCTGDGSIGEKSGAEYLFGRESSADFGEVGAIDRTDTVTQGNTIQFRSLDAGREVPFVRPDWAYDFSGEEWVYKKSWDWFDSGFWWVELGGTKLNVLTDSEEIKTELLKIVYGLWDIIKNYSEQKENAKTHYLDWVGFVSAKRETRRVVGDYVLTETDILGNKVFDDAISYGGWHIDSHRPECFYAHVNDTPQTEDKSVMFEGVYTVPYRTIYSKDIENLYIGGRCISATHRAFCSTRVMATCAVAGEAAGVAAALAVKKGKTARQLLDDITELQQLILRNGCYIPEFKNEDKNDKARKAHITASSEEKGFEAINVINGVSRPVGDNSNMWQSHGTDESISLKWDEPQSISKVELTFDSNLSVEIMISLTKWCHAHQTDGVPNTIVKDYKIEYLLDGKAVDTKEIKNNHQRVNVIESNALCDEIRVTVEQTHGLSDARIIEVRTY